MVKWRFSHTRSKILKPWVHWRGYKRNRPKTENLSSQELCTGERCQPSLCSLQHCVHATLSLLSRREKLFISLCFPEVPRCASAVEITLLCFILSVSLAQKIHSAWGRGVHLCVPHEPSAISEAQQELPWCVLNSLNGCLLNSHRKTLAPAHKLPGVIVLILF